MTHIIDRVVTRSFWIIGRVVTLWWFAGNFSGVPVSLPIGCSFFTQFYPRGKIRVKTCTPNRIVDRRACPNPKRREGIPKRDSITVDPRNETVTVLLIYVTISNYVTDWSRKKKNAFRNRWWRHTNDVTTMISHRRESYFWLILWLSSLQFFCFQVHWPWTVNISPLRTATFCACNNKNCDKILIAWSTSTSLKK